MVPGNSAAPGRVPAGGLQPAALLWFKKYYTKGNELETEAGVYCDHSLSRKRNPFKVFLSLWEVDFSRWESSKGDLHNA
jgi:hypothetical protein